MQVSAYELYTAPFGASPDKVFRSLDQHPYVGGGFAWSGWDYLGEPTPYYLARSSYCGIIDLAGFPKERYYLYQAHWRPEMPMVHILPHWNWPDRLGDTIPVHLFTSGDEVELFLNGRSLGRKTKGAYEYRLRWDKVAYQPGEIKATAYKHSEKWAETVIRTSGEPYGIKAVADREVIQADGHDLSFVTVQVVDENGEPVPNAHAELEFSVEGPGRIIATDNGDPTDLTSFPSLKRKTFNGLALAIVRSEAGRPGMISFRVVSPELESESISIESR
jgi:beta-galactosidase